MTATAAPQSLKDRHRATWAAGDYGAVADGSCSRSASASSSASRPAPRARCSTSRPAPATPPSRPRCAGPASSASTSSPSLLDVARRRAAHAGVDVEWIEGDAEDLPFADGSFDVVLSTLGVQFAPRHEDSARELVARLPARRHDRRRNWTPQGYIGRFFTTLSPYMPPPPEGVSPPPLWGDEGHVARLFGGAVRRARVRALDRRLRARVARRRSSTSWPTTTARWSRRARRSTPARPLGGPAQRPDRAQRGDRTSPATARFRVPSEYLLAVARV